MKTHPATNRQMKTMTATPMGWEMASPLCALNCTASRMATTTSEMIIWMPPWMNSACMAAASENMSSSALQPPFACGYVQCSQRPAKPLGINNAALAVPRLAREEIPGYREAHLCIPQLRCGYLACFGLAMRCTLLACCQASG